MTVRKHTLPPIPIESTSNYNLPGRFNRTAAKGVVKRQVRDNEKSIEDQILALKHNGRSSRKSYRESVVGNMHRIFGNYIIAETVTKRYHSFVVAEHKPRACMFFLKTIKLDLKRCTMDVIGMPCAMTEHAVERMIERKPGPQFNRYAFVDILREAYEGFLCFIDCDTDDYPQAGDFNMYCDYGLVIGECDPRAKSFLVKTVIPHSALNPAKHARWESRLEDNAGK